MWIKHNNALYNTDDISRIDLIKSVIQATFKDGSEEIIGSFKSQKEAKDIFTNITSALLFEDKDHPGIIIKDTKGTRNTSL